MCVCGGGGEGGNVQNVGGRQWGRGKIFAVN